jgi:NADH:ubiquinone reductase (H+-translocating)
LHSVVGFILNTASSMSNTEQLARIPDTAQPRIVIVGGGFGGVELAKALNKADAQVVLIDKINYHTFQPLLYQVATSGLDSSSIVAPFRKFLGKQKNFYFRLAEVKQVLPEKNMLDTSIGAIRYDYLVIATGASTNYYGMADIEKYAVPMKSLNDAILLRNHILENFEAALQSDDKAQLNSFMDFVVVGGGPTGVEVAGALSELRSHVFPQDYKELDLFHMDIHLIEASPRLLNGMSEKAGNNALAYLKSMGVNVQLSTGVKSYDGETVTLSTGETLKAKTLVWGAGVKGSPLNGLKTETIVRGNRIKVDEYNKAVGYENIFAVGDVACMMTEATPNGHPMVAQPAMQQGVNLAYNLKKLLRKDTNLRPFKYFDMGGMATIGRNKAVADIFGFEFGGFLAWAVWLFVHLMSLVGFKNRFFVFFNWLSSYFSYDKSNRLIIKK